MNRNDVKVGQIVTIGMEVEFWGNPDDTRLDWRTDRWCKWEIVSIKDHGPEYDYASIEVKCMDGVCSDTIELDIDFEDIELAS
jgi:hypothetical protein